jgi:hypothetical protein
MTVLTRDQILAAVDMKIEAVDVPEWGGTVHVRSLKGCERDLFEASRYQIKGREVELIHENTRAKLLAVSLCDEAGAVLFSERDVVALGEKNASALDRVYEVAMRLSGLRAKDAEAKLKNSEAAQIDASSSN